MSHPARPTPALACALAVAVAAAAGRSHAATYTVDLRGSGGAFDFDKHTGTAPLTTGSPYTLTLTAGPGALDEVNATSTGLGVNGKPSGDDATNEIDSIVAAETLTFSFNFAGRLTGFDLLNMSTSGTGGAEFEIATLTVPGGAVHRFVDANAGTSDPQYIKLATTGSDAIAGLNFAFSAGQPFVFGIARTAGLATAGYAIETLTVEAIPEPLALGLLGPVAVTFARRPLRD